MNSVENEQQLITSDITSVLQDYTSVQSDIDETRIKAAALIAQKIDIRRIIGEDNLNRAISPQSTEDEALKALLTPTLAFFTYSRALTLFNGSFTDSGYVTEEDKDTKGTAKVLAAEYHSVGEAHLEDVLLFLENENDKSVEEGRTKMTPKIRVFGGQEWRASN